MQAISPTRKSKGAPNTLSKIQYHIDCYTVFQGSLRVAGWICCDGEAITSLKLRTPSGRRYAFSQWQLPSPDLVPHFGVQGARSRFDMQWPLGAPESSVIDAVLEIQLRNGQTFAISGLGRPGPNPANGLVARFRQELERWPETEGHVLEIGSRSPTGSARRDLAPAGWSFTGLDLVDGPNVDMLGDAHELRALYPANHFDAVVSFFAFEHLLMPWKVALELNHVMKPGAIGLVMSHQCWPLQDPPGDYWRFSDQAWTALFNPATGFEILDAQMGDPAFVVAARHHAGVALGAVAGAQMSSAVLFRKTGDTALSWPVSLNRVHSPAPRTGVH